MQLNGNKKQVNITLNTESYILTVDSANKVVNMQYNGNTTLAQIKVDINTVVESYGFEPIAITHKKVKDFKFK